MGFTGSSANVVDKLDASVGLREVAKSSPRIPPASPQLHQLLLLARMLVCGYHLQCRFALRTPEVVVGQGCLKQRMGEHHSHRLALMMCAPQQQLRLTLAED